MTLRSEINENTSVLEKDWPIEGLEFVGRCLICGSDKRKVLYEGLRDCVFLSAPGTWTLYCCINCGSAYLDPRPSIDTIQLAYQTYYTHTLQQRVATEDLSLRRRVIRALANGYRNHRYGGNLRPALRVGWIIVRLLPSHRHKLDRELRYLPRVWPSARLLDVGFGGGSFLDAAKQVGWSVSGVDPDPTTVANARSRGLDVRQGGIEAYVGHQERFDVITLNHVIEHLHSPIDTLKHAFSLLRPGGYLYIETPNIDAIGHKEYKQFWRGLEPPRHLMIFSWNAMEDMLVRSGYCKIKRFRLPNDYQRLSSKSRAIKEGSDPYRLAKVTMRDQFKGAFATLASLVDHSRSEFIRLVARKP